MTAYTALAEHVGVDTPGIDFTFLADAVRDAVIEWCERTRAYVYDAPAISVVAATGTYTPVLPAGTVMWDVIKALHDDDELFPQTKQFLDKWVQNWRLAATTGVPEYYYLSADRTQIRLVKTPASALADGLVLELALKPSRTSTSCPDFIFENHKPAVQAGAKWKLFSMQKKPWTNPQLAAYHMHEFNSLCGVDSAFADRNNTRAPLRTAPQR